MKSLRLNPTFVSKSISYRYRCKELRLRLKGTAHKVRLALKKDVAPPSFNLGSDQP